MEFFQLAIQKLKNNNNNKLQNKRKEISHIVVIIIHEMRAHIMKFLNMNKILGVSAVNAKVTSFIMGPFMFNELIFFGQNSCLILSGYEQPRIGLEMLLVI